MSKITIYSEACNKVDGFRAMGEEFKRKLIINGRSKSTHENYLRQIAKLALYYMKNPLHIDMDELEEYLYYLMQKDT
ncbi:phage integrase N-terminal SAM-like domain-containing protein, partial [Lentimicrobium sp. S6]